MHLEQIESLVARELFLSGASFCCAIIGSSFVQGVLSFQEFLLELFIPVTRSFRLDFSVKTEIGSRPSNSHTIRLWLLPDIG